MNIMKKQSTWNKTIKLGPSDIEVSALGAGCWAIGGQFSLDGKADGWGNIDDSESIRSIQTAIELGVNFFDTSDAYGTGHSENILGKAVKGNRDKIVIATKFGFTIDEKAKEIRGTNVSPVYIKQACHASLKRLNTDYIDLYQLHCGASSEELPGVLTALDELKREGSIRSYGWSTGSSVDARACAGINDFVVIQHEMNIFNRSDQLLKICKEQNMASIIRSPLAMGLLTGKYKKNKIIAKDDFRSAGHRWVNYFKAGKPVAAMVDKLEAIREILIADGRTLIQGALGWI